MTTLSHSSARDQTLSAKYQLCIRILLLQEPIIPPEAVGERVGRRDGIVCGAMLAPGSNRWRQAPSLHTTNRPDKTEATSCR